MRIVQCGRRADGRFKIVSLRCEASQAKKKQASSRGGVDSLLVSPAHASRSESVKSKLHHKPFRLR